MGMNCMRKPSTDQKTAHHKSLLLTSENALWQPSWSHTWGFSPVWVRECTVSALRWIKLLLQSATVQW